MYCHRLVMEPDFNEDISRGEVEIEVVPDENEDTDDGGQLPLPPIVLDLNNITILNATGKSLIYKFICCRILICNKIYV